MPVAVATGRRVDAREGGRGNTRAVYSRHGLLFIGLDAARPALEVGKPTALAATIGPPTGMPLGAIDGWPEPANATMTGLSGGRKYVVVFFQLFLRR